MQFLVLALLPLALLVLLIILIARSSGHSIRIGALERHVNDLSQELESLRNEIDAAKIPGSRKKIAEKERPVAGEQPEPQRAGALATAPTPAPIPGGAQPIKPSRTREEWEALIGGKLLNRIGALALIIGIGFFLKYAFDNNWIGETTRVLIGAAIGILCLLGGYRTHKRNFEIFAQGLVGAGIAILYLSVYAAFNFYHLMPQWVAFVFMSVVTLIALLNGLFYNSLAEGILGWAGGFLTPILLSTGQASELGLFTYIVLLDAGLIAMVVKRDKWAILEPLSFIGTWLMYISWREEYFTDADLWLSVFFVIVFWVLFLAPDIFRSKRTGGIERFNLVISVLNAAFTFLALYFLIDKDHHAWMGLTTLLLGAVYFGVVFVQQRRSSVREDVKLLYLLTALSLLAIATAVQFSDFDTVIVWSVEASALVWCSREWKQGFLQTAAMILFGCTVFKLLLITGNGLTYSPIREFVLLLNHRALAFAVLAGALGYGAFTIDRSANDNNKQASNVLHVGWSVILFLLVTAETADFFRFKMLDQQGEIVQRLSYFRNMTFGVVWITLSLPLVFIGLKRKLMALVASGVVIASLAILFEAVRGVAFDPIDYYVPLFNIRSISLLLVITGLVLHTQFMEKAPDVFAGLKDVLSYVQVGTVLVILVLLTGETRDFFQKDIVALAGQIGVVSAEARRLLNLQQMSLSGVWLVYSAVLMALGLWRKYRWMRFAAIVLFGFTILKIFIYDLSVLETVYRVFSFVALGAILIAVSYAYQKYKDIIGGKM